MGNGASVRNLDEAGVGEYEGSAAGGEGKVVTGILNTSYDDGVYDLSGGYSGAEGEDAWAEVEYGEENYNNWESAPADSSDETVIFTFHSCNIPAGQCGRFY